VEGWLSHLEKEGVDEDDVTSRILWWSCGNGIFREAEESQQELLEREQGGFGGEKIYPQSLLTTRAR